MSKFIKLRFKELLKDETIAFGPDLLKIINPFDPAALGIAAAVAKVDTAWQNLSGFMQDANGSVLTDDLIALDARRDADLTGIKMAARAMLNHRDAAKRSAAELVINTMDGFDRNIPRQALAVQTKTVVELIKVFETDAKVKAAMDLLNLSEWVGPLKITNAELSDKYLERARADGDKPATTFIEQKAVAEMAMLELFTLVEAKNVLTPDPKLDQLTAQTNELISKYNRMVAQRKAKGGKSKDGNGDAPAP